MVVMPVFMQARVLFISGLLAFLLACGQSTSHPVLPAGSTVVAFGDSITHGTGAAAGESYPLHLAALTGWTLINAGVPGELARDAGARLPVVLTQHTPDLVLVELGGNDFLRQRPAQQVKEDLRALLKAVRAGGATPVLVAVPRFSMLRATAGLLSDSPIYAELAAEEDVPLVADALSTVLSDEGLRADPIHPNSAGYRVLAEAIAVSLREYGLLQ